MEAKVDPRAEWRQMFRDAWRLERDFFYDPGMHGVDWDAMYERYGQLVPYVAHGADFSYILGEMIGELNSRPRLRRGRATCRGPSESAPACWAATSSWTRRRRYRIARIFSERDWNGGAARRCTSPA